MSRSHTVWLTWAASSSHSPYFWQVDQTSGIYRSTSVSHACLLPSLARITKAVTRGSPRDGCNLSAISCPPSDAAGVACCPAAGPRNDLQPLSLADQRDDRQSCA